MDKLIKKTIDIECPTELVWSVVFEKENYNQWNSVFNNGSTYQGRIGLNEVIRYYDKDGYGLEARIINYKPYDLIKLKYVNEYHNHILQKQSSFRNKVETYQFTRTDNGTRLVIDFLVSELYFEKLSEMWDTSLSEIKKLCIKLSREVR